MSTVLNAITLNNDHGVNLTNRLVEIPISSRNFNFSSVSSSGTNLDILDSNKSTSLSHSNRLWNQSVGLSLTSTWNAPTGDGTFVYRFAGQIQAGNLSLPNGPHTLWSAGTDLSGVTGHGQLDCYDKNQNHVWTFKTPTNHDYIMSCTIGDVNGDGINEIAVGSRQLDAFGYLLNNSGTVLWSWPNVASQYTRVATIGNMRNDLAGKEVLFASSNGDIALVGSGGNELWKININYSPALRTVQHGIIEDLDNSGQAFIYVTQSTNIVKINNAGTIIWRFSDIFNNVFSSYQIAAGYITSLSEKQLVIPGAVEAGGHTESIGFVSCVDKDGNLLWKKIFPFCTTGVSCGDVNGDGYDEVIVGWGTSVANANPTGWGGIIILDRNGNEIACTSMGSIPSSTLKFLDYDGTGKAKPLVTCTDRKLYHFDYMYGVNAGGTIKALIPNIAASSQKTIYLARSNGDISPPIGDYYFNLNGSVPVNTTMHGGSWTIANGLLTSNDDANSSLANCCEFNNTLVDSMELEYDAYKPGQADGTQNYYTGIRYRCANFSNDRPDGYQVIVNSGNVQLTRTQSDVGNIFTIYQSATGVLFNTTDKVRYRAVVANNDHSLAYSKNDGAWTLLYTVQDTNPNPILTSGSIAFVNNRGQSAYNNMVLKSIPNAFTVDGPGPGPSISVGNLAQIVIKRFRWLGGRL